MPSAVTLRTDFSADDLRRLARRAKSNNQSRRLLSLAAVLDGMTRTDAARIGGMDRRTLRDAGFIASTKPALTGFWAAGPSVQKRGSRRDRRPNSLQSSKPGPTPRLMAWCAGGASIFSTSSRIVSVSTTTSVMSARYCINPASRMSARGRVIPGRTSRRSRLSKKLLPHIERSSRRCSKSNAGRDMVSGQSPYRPEERHCPAMGKARNPPKAARRSAL